MSLIITLVDRNPERVAARDVLGLSNTYIVAREVSHVQVTYDALHAPDTSILAYFTDESANSPTNTHSGWTCQDNKQLYSDIDIREFV